MPPNNPSDQESQLVDYKVLLMYNGDAHLTSEATRTDNKQHTQNIHSTHQIQQINKTIKRDIISSSDHIEKSSLRNLTAAGITDLPHRSESYWLLGNW